MIIVPACALVDNDDRIYITQRQLNVDEGGLWEFPGGKRKINETVTQALIRELKEEIGIDTSDTCLAPVTFAVKEGLPSKETIIILLYICRKWTHSPKALQAIQGKWVHVNQLHHYHMPQCNNFMISILRDLLMN